MAEDFNPDDYLKQKTGSDEFDPDEYLRLQKRGELRQKIDDAPTTLEARARQRMLEGFGNLARKVDSVTGAPIRAGIGAAADGKNPLSAAYEQFGADPEKAPSGKDLAARAGLSTDETSIGFTLNPWDRNQDLKVSPAGLAGAAIETVADPLTFIPGAAISKGIGLGAKGAAKLSPKVAKYLEGMAYERAVKAATGQNKAKFLEMAGVTRQRPKEMAEVQANIRNVGKTVMDEGLLGWFDRPESLAPKLSKRVDEVGSEIGSVQKAVDELRPGAITGKGISQRIMDDTARTIPSTPQGNKLQENILEKAAEYESAKPMSFKDAQFEKNQYKYKPTDASPLVSNQDVSNLMQGAISEEMEAVVEQLAKQGGDVGAILEKYPEMKKRYGALIKARNSATERSLSNLSNRYVSPSDHGAGITGAMLASQKDGSKPLEAITIGTLAAAANKQFRERGSAFAARSLKTAATQLFNAPGRLQKYTPYLQQAAKGGMGSLSAAHRFLLNNDPGYGDLLEELGREGD